MTSPKTRLIVAISRATMFHILGIDHKRFTYPFRGLDIRLTGVGPARVVRGVLA